MFDDEFVESLSVDPTEGAVQICDRILLFHNEQARGSVEYFDQYMEGYALLSSYLETNQLGIGLPQFGEDKTRAIQELVKAASDIKKFLEHRLAAQSIESMKAKFQAKFKGSFCYEFSEGDLKRIQTLINELRQNISEFNGFESDHRQRLLRRLERLQSELHKKVSDVDRFWGLIGDAGVVIRKFGDDAKPIVDRIREIADIVWRTQSRAEELPSGTKPPLISSDENQET